MNAARFMRIGPLKVVLVGALLATVLVALLLMLVAAEDPAEAAFPGKNGKIAFVEFGGGNNEIYTMNADGTNQTQLTTNLGHDSWPAWSPDGTKIAFETVRDGSNYPEIYVMNADGSNQTNITKNSAENYQPTWSPDGTKIAFLRVREDGDPEIYVMNADGSNQTNITNNPGHDSDPAWSPDGTKIAFETDRSGNSEIYTMNADGSAQTNVTNTSSAYEGGPDWQPLPGPTLPTSKAECKNGGYKDFGFKTQGLCLASVQGAANSP